MGNVRIMRTSKVIAIYSVVFGVGLFYLFPLYWTFVTSFKPVQEIIRVPPTIVPLSITLRHYSSVLLQSNYLFWVRNSVLIGTFATFLTLLMALGTGYSISRLRFPGRRLLEIGVLVVYLFPGILLIIPLFQVMHLLGLHDRIWSVVITHVLLGLPFGTWTVRAFIATIPTEIDDAARLDGASRLQMLISVYSPLLGPGLATVAIFAFVASWNDYLYPVVFLSRPRSQVISVGIASWTAAYSIDWGQVAAAAMLTILPVVIFYAIAGKYFVKGLSAGAVKG